MRPENNSVQTPAPRSTAVTPPTRDYKAHHQAAADIARSQLDTIYTTQPATGSTQQSQNVYSATHQDARTINDDDWNKYHSSWQNYYQKYYEHYYVNAVQQVHETYQQHAQNTLGQSSDDEHSSRYATKGQATATLRRELRNKIRERSEKVKKSRHFVPLVAALSVAGLFVILQYNSTFIAYAQAYIAPGNLDPQNIIVDPNQSIKVDPAPRLIIPKINVDISVDYTATTEYDSQMASMRDNVAYFGIPGADSKPGQLGNVPLSGHSSNDFSESGSAKFIFARLEQLQKGDVFYLHYEGTRYAYTVFDTIVVKPTDVSALNIGTDKPYATLITCTPLGTSQDRLLVFAEQISPSAADAAPAPETASSDATGGAALAGKSPTILERLLGIR